MGANRQYYGVIMQILAVATKRPQLPVPTFSASSTITGGYTFTITNYDAANTYTVSTTAGSVVHSSGTVTQSGLGYSTSTTVTVVVNRSGYTSSSATTTGTSAGAPCTPNGCTPTCSYTFSYSVPAGGSLIGCGVPGCGGGCRYWDRDYYTATAPTASCADGCGGYNTISCSGFNVDSTVASTCV